MENIELTFYIRFNTALTVSYAFNLMEKTSRTYKKWNYISDSLEIPYTLIIYTMLLYL